jgi:RNA polymerase sigma factor (sigma-70 family)
MDPRPTQVLLHQIRKLAAAPEAGQPDTVLLQQFISRQDTAAFAALVERHGPLVLSVSRRVLREWHAAEDVFQATFLVLARKAASIRKRAALGSWLYGVAYRLANRARVEAARRHARESQLPARSEPDPAADVSWREVCAVLDEELQRLPEKLRVPLVLCHLEGKTRDEAAREAGWSLRTLHRCLERCQALLRTRLARRGVQLSLTLLVTGLARNASAASLSPALVWAIVQPALSFAAGRPAADGSAAVFTLAEKGIHAMELAKLKVVSACVATIALLGAGAGLLGHRATAAKVPAAIVPTAAERLVPPTDAKAAERQARAAALLREALENLDDKQGELTHRTLADIAVLQARLGEREEARKTFAQARQLADERQGDSKYWEWRVLATAYASAGEADEALALVEASPVNGPPNGQGKDNEFRDMVLQECAEALARAGHGKEALRLVERLENKSNRPWNHAMVVTKLALTQAKQGRFDTALQTVASLPDAGDKVMALTGVIYTNMTYADYPNEPGVALLQAKAGNRAGAHKTLQRAVALLRDVKDAAQQDRARTALVCALVLLGDLAPAVRTAKEIQKDAYLYIAQAAVAQAQAAAGQNEAAIRRVEVLADKEAQVHGLYHVALGQVQAGDQQGARDTLAKAFDLGKTLPDDAGRLQFHNLASVQARAGDFQGALDTVRNFLPAGSVAFANIVHEQAKAGDLKGATETAGTFKEGDWWQGNALRDIARELTENGKDKEAVAWAKELPTAFARSHALLGAAEGLLRTDAKE